MELIDENQGTGDHNESLARVYRHGTLTVRIHVSRNFYAGQSYASACVLSQQNTWTVIAEDQPGNWHRAGKPLGEVADGLVKRAAVILG